MNTVIPPLKDGSIPGETLIYDLFATLNIDESLMHLTDDEKARVFEKETLWRVPLYALMEIIQENINKNPGRNLSLLLRSKKVSGGNGVWFQHQSYFIAAEDGKKISFWQINTDDLAELARARVDQRTKDLFSRVDDPVIRAKKEAYEIAKQEYENALKDYYSQPA